MHRDGTCRIQTVAQQSQPQFHRLISAFSRLTGVPLVLNTSYNDQEPLCVRPTTCGDVREDRYRRPVLGEPAVLRSPPAGNRST